MQGDPGAGGLVLAKIEADLKLNAGLNLTVGSLAIVGDIAYQHIVDKLNYKNYIPSKGKVFEFMLGKLKDSATVCKIKNVKNLIELVENVQKLYEGLEKTFEKPFDDMEEAKAKEKELRNQAAELQRLWRESFGN